MRARYLGDHDNFAAWGIPFPRGVFVEVSDAHAQKKIAGNSHFEIEQSDAEDVDFKMVESCTLPAEAAVDGDVPPFEFKEYSDGTSAFGPGPLPDLSPDQQDALTATPQQSYPGARRGPKPKAK